MSTKYIQTPLPQNKNALKLVLFGGTGAGKSTTINAFANYCRYESFEDAERGEFTSVIPSQITLFHPVTFEEVTVTDQKHYSDKNEQYYNVGQSVTQSAKSYRFTFDHQFKVELIDTPGMGDTRGEEMDRKNFEHTRQYLLNSSYINAILFLLPTTTTRETATFQYVLDQLLLRLNDFACAHIIFLFTYSRNSSYGPGDAYKVLSDYLQSNPCYREKLQLQVGVNCYFIDNEAYRYLMVRKYAPEYPLEEDTRESYVNSWNESATQIRQMLAHISGQLSSIAVRNLFQEDKPQKDEPHEGNSNQPEKQGLINSPCKECYPRNQKLVCLWGIAAITFFMIIVSICYFIVNQFDLF